MLANAISRVRAFLGSRQNVIALATLPILGGWLYSRLWMVNPAILGDEFLYSMNARKVSPWAPPVAGDFSNYLFNFVYQGTNLCGDAFYTCGKVFNLTFFLGFIFTIFIVAHRFLPFWAAYLFMISAGLSPLGVYTSMFLPESMYFFFIGLVFLATLRAIGHFSWQNWALVGTAIGVASLVKPHAWLSAIAVGVTMLVVGLFNPEIRFKKTLQGGIGLVAGAVLARVALGLIVAGPKALSFFGAYLRSSTVQTVFEGTSEEGQNSDQILTPIDGVVSLFGAQLNIHLLTIASLMSMAVLGLAAGVMEILKTRRLTEASALALFSFIWLASITIEIVMFTGWVTGTGDDHSTRVLVRYYEFLFVIVPLAGIVALVKQFGERINSLIRWAMAGAVAIFVTPAFTGFFGTLTIQIADAPTLAGLVVNMDVFNAVAVLSFLSLVLFAAFPRYSAWAFVVLLPVTMIGTGWQIQDQYQKFRGTPNAADIVGQQIARDFTDDELAKTWVLGTSRFEATNVAIWADNKDLTYELFGPGSQLEASMAPLGTQKIVVVGELQIVSGASLVSSGDGFAVYEID